MTVAASTPRAGRALTWIVAVGAGIRVVHWVTKWDRELLLNDSLYYSGQAYQLANGVWYRELFVDQPGAEHGPLTSTLMAAFTWGDDYVRWQRVVTVITGIALVWVIGLLGTRLRGPRAGLLAAGIAAVAPNLWMNDGLVMSESVSMLVVGLTLWCALDAVEREGVRPWVLLGAVLGLGALARSELALLAPLVLVWCGIIRRKAGERSLRPLLVASASLLAVVGPWVVFNMARFERPVVLTTNDGTTWLGANCDDAYRGPAAGGWSLACVIADPDYRPDEEPSVRSARQRSLAIDYVTDHLDDVPRVVAARVARTLDLYGLDNLVRQDVGEERARWASWAGIVSFWWMAVASALAVRRLARRHRWLLALPVGVVRFTTVMFYGGHRIRSSAEPTLVLLTAVAIDVFIGARGYGVAARPSERPGT
jgi:hypothetical protein